MNTPLISIIVPVYNVETYVSRCIDSILAQTYTNFELLLINDGSSDKSGEICDEYSRLDSRIQIFHKNNGGVSSARNLGLDNAKGEWICFVDSDDWVSADWIESAYNVISRSSNIKMVQWGYTIVNCNDYNPIILKENIFQSSERFIKSHSYKHMVWDYMFNRDIININDIRFVNTKYSEDQNFLLKYLSFEPNVEIINRSLYFYCMRSDSVVASPIVMATAEDNLIVAIDFMKYSIKKPNTNQDFIKHAISNLFVDYIHYLGLSQDLNSATAKRVYRHYFNELTKNTSIFKHSIKLRIPLYSFRLTILLLRLYHLYRKTITSIYRVYSYLKNKQ